MPEHEHEQPTNVIAALSRVMSELGAIGKDQESPQGYAYRGIEQITARAQVLFATYGIVIVPKVLQWEQVPVVKPANWTDDRLRVRFRFYGPGGPADYIDAVVTGIGRDNSDKGSNKALTQAFKYALLQVLCISDPKDDGDAHRMPAEEPPAPPEPTITDEQRDALHATLTAVGKSLGAYPQEWIDAGLPSLSLLLSHSLPLARHEEALRILAAHAFPDVPVEPPEEDAPEPAPTPAPAKRARTRKAAAPTADPTDACPECGGAAIIGRPGVYVHTVECTAPF